jgi:hypothetical protein
MTKRTKAVSELLEKGELVHVAGVTVADAGDGPAVHMSAVIDFIAGMRGAIRQARLGNLDTVTATNDVDSWERLCASFSEAANALSLQVFKAPKRLGKRPS